METSGFFSRGHMLSWLHTVDIENLLARVVVGGGGIGGKGGTLGGYEETNDRGRSPSEVMPLSLSELVRFEVSLTRLVLPSAQSPLSAVMRSTICEELCETPETRRCPLPWVPSFLLGWAKN
jgi:hypothetical protein